MTGVTLVESAADRVVAPTVDTTTSTIRPWPMSNEVWAARQNPGEGEGAATWTETSWAVTTSKTWVSWVRNQSATTTAIHDPWPLWIVASVAGSPSINADFRRVSVEEYRAQHREHQRRAEERERRWVAEESERRAARLRARLLLRENLTEAQKAELADKCYFTLQIIDSETGERRNYRIHQGRSRNVEQVDDNGRRIRTLCAHPAIDCPDEDTMLAQKLWLETREKEFLRVANHS